MTSDRKRKRDPVDIDSSKSIKEPQFSAPSIKVEKHAPSASQEQLKKKLSKTTLKVKKEDTNAVLPAESPKTKLVKKEVKEVLPVEQVKQKRQEKKVEKAERKERASRKDRKVWKLSEPAGGRMLNIDPVFVGNEEYVIVANRLSLQVYSTSTSLLIKSIPLAVKDATTTSTRIVAHCLSPSNPAFCWVACSDGAVFRVDWTSGSGAEEYWTTSSTGLVSITVASMLSAGRIRDVVFTTEPRKEGGYRISTHELTRPGDAVTTAVKTIFTISERIHDMKTLAGGEIIVAAAEKKVLIGSLRSSDFNTVDNIKYQFQTFELADYITSLDARIGGLVAPASTKKDHATPKKTNSGNFVVDMAVGDAKGSIFLYSDILNLIKSHQTILPKKLHWHRKAVSSVKWSRDGNYLISGGSETVLVLWQLETGHKQFLPHLSAEIQNIVISPRGNSYAVHIADNSTMILSTSELTPTANFAGIQAPVIETTKSLGSYVERVDNQKSSAITLNHTPAVISPSNPTHILLAVGETQEIGPELSAVESAPYLQTFDIFKSQHVARQALARTNITNHNIGPQGRRLIEPKITHMQTSHDGSWLATVDEWHCSDHDIALLSDDEVTAEFFKREVFLKFWQWNSTDEIWELVSRVDAPHAKGNGTRAVGRVLDLVADPTSLKFSTIGEDGIVRVWRPKTRKRDNVIVRGKDGNPLRTWSCRNAIPLRINETDIEIEHRAKKTVERERTASLAYSEDGSILAAAVSGVRTGSICLLNPETGSIHHTLSSQFGGDIVRMAILNKYLITLSDELRVYDLVEYGLSFGLVASKTMRSLSLGQKRAMVHLAVDRTQQTFAVAIPRIKHNAKESHWTGLTDITIFDPSKPDPLYNNSMPGMITTLLPTTTSTGYLILDTYAEIRTLAPKAAQIAFAIKRHLSEEDQVDGAVVEEASVVNIMELAQDDAISEEESALTQESDQDEEFPVVTQQQLTSVFDIGPAYALPPIEEMFYQVVDLFAPKSQS